MLQRNHTRNAIEYYHTARREEKKIYTKKKKDHNEDRFKELEYFRPMNKGKGFCWILNRSRKVFQLGITLCTDESVEILIQKGLINRRCTEHFDWLLNPEEHKPQQCINTVESMGITETFSNRRSTNSV